MFEHILPYQAKLIQADILNWYFHVFSFISLGRSFIAVHLQGERIGYIHVRCASKDAAECVLLACQSFEHQLCQVLSLVHGDSLLLLLQ